MQLILLTHSRETHKASNTGQLISRVYPDVQTIIWQRTEPDKALLKLIAEGETALVFQQEKSIPSDHVSKYKRFILIDSTWQEARKIYNRSPYLHDLPCIQFSTGKQSRYSLRRNQLDGGLCTAECVMELFSAAGLNVQVNLLGKEFSTFIGEEQ
jgi:tRNA-uridine aminocarboxypropyltransferase